LKANDSTFEDWLWLYEKIEKLNKLLVQRMDLNGEQIKFAQKCYIGHTNLLDVPLCHSKTLLKQGKEFVL
jgi:hypothetical protein